MKDTKTVEERFDDMFPEWEGNMANAVAYNQKMRKAKDFLLQEIDKAKADERERIAGVCEKIDINPTFSSEFMRNYGCEDGDMLDMEQAQDILDSYKHLIIRNITQEDEK